MVEGNDIQNTEETTVVEGNDIQNTEETTVVEGDGNAESVLSDAVKRVLKIFKNLPEAYISSNGGIYTTNTKPSLRGNAILYKNPFYNS